MNNQRSPEWFAARAGKVTASRVADVMAKTKSGPAASRKNYMAELLCQRLTGVCDESGFSSNAMQRGEELEPVARSAYEINAGVMVEECGLIVHPDIEHFGASPDALVGSDGLLEIKCPNTATHIDFLRSGVPDGRYQWQMLAQMSCTGRNWCDFVSYDDRMPEWAQYKCVRFHIDNERHAEMLEEIKRFLAELDAMVQDILKMKEQ